MSTILETDAEGTLHLPPSLLPHPGSGRRYRVTTEGGRVVVDEAAISEAARESREAWLKKLDSRRARGITGKAGTPLQQIFDDLRGGDR